MQKTKKNIVSITITPQLVTCAWISSPTPFFPFTLHATTAQQFHDIFHDSIKPFNSTHLQKVVTHFITTHSIKKSYLAIALAGAPLQEAITSLPHSAEIATQHYLWQSCPLFPLASGETAHYKCGIPASVLLQYQLLAIRIGRPLMRVTTDTHALLTLYRAIHGAAYRASKLADHLQAQKNNLYNLFSKETIARILKAPANFSFSLTDSTAALLTACGLTLLENKKHE